MIRQIISIDEDKCNGCGICAEACHEGALTIINGKAKLIREDYCDGLGDCLPACPEGAITFVLRDAPEYDEKAVLEAKKHKESIPIMCKGSGPAVFDNGDSELSHWPIQIKLVPVKAPFFDGKDLLVASDCSAFAYRDFHNDFIKGRATVVGCPKLDSVDYSDKLSEILIQNDIKSITVTRMEVPCCGGLEFAVRKAVEKSEKNIPVKVVTISSKGKIL